MSKSLKSLLIVGGIVVVIIFLLGGSYNGLVRSEEEVTAKFADISVQLERRADLIPNLVNSVKGYMQHEKDVIDSIASARQQLVNAGTVEEKASANSELTSALNRLLVVVENYPELKANTNFIQLQDELAGTENRISVSRSDYNNAVKSYNQTIKTFPKNILARMFGFEEKQYFEAKASSTEVPNVSFE